MSRGNSAKPAAGPPPAELHLVAELVHLAERAGRRRRAIQAAFGAFRPELAELDRELTTALLRLDGAVGSEAEEGAARLRRDLDTARTEIRSLLEKSQH